MTVFMTEPEAKVLGIENRRGAPLAKLPVKTTRKARCPLEHEEQSAFIKWCSMKGINMIFAIPNAAKRGWKTASMMKAEGMKAGVPDLFIAMPKNGYHGLFIEMKRIKGGSLSTEQKQWICELNRQGYKAEVCQGCDMAIKVIEAYLG